MEILLIIIIFLLILILIVQFIKINKLNETLCIHCETMNRLNIILMYFRVKFSDEYHEDLERSSERYDYLRDNIDIK